MDKKENKNWNILVYLHAALLLWALLFLSAAFVLDDGKFAGVLAIGNALFLFINIPFALFSLALKRKGYFTQQYSIPVVILSILNIAVGIVAWYYFVQLLLKF